MANANRPAVPSSIAGADVPEAAGVDADVPMPSQCARLMPLRIVVVLLIWLAQPIIFLAFELGPLKAYGAYGFLGNALGWVILAFLIALTAFVLSVGAWRRKLAAASGAVALVLALALLVSHGQGAAQFVDDGAYDPSAAQQLASENLAEDLDAYRPFTGAAVARLDGPSTLRFGEEERLPRVDAATALLPLASAFVTATYPEDAVTVQWEEDAVHDAFCLGASEGLAAGCEATWEQFQGGAQEDEAARAHLPWAADAQAQEQAYDEGFAIGYEQGQAIASEHARGSAGADRAWEDAYERIAGPAQDAVFQYNNSSTGFTMLAECRTDVFLGTKADEEQARTVARMGIELDYAPIGREGFVFLVSADNPVDSLTVQQVKDIYAGRITNWQEVGGDDAPIVAYQRNANSGSQSMMERFMAGDELVEAPERLTHGSMGGLVRALAQYDNGANAIGYSFRYYVTDLVGDYDVKMLAIDGVAPTLEAIAAEEYPITGEFYAVTRKGDESEPLRRLVEWMQGSQGQELVVKSGYAPLA